MKVDTLKQLGALYYVLEFVGSGEKSERDVIAYQMSRGMPESTARRNTKSICNGECPLFIVTDSGIFPARSIDAPDGVSNAAKQQDGALPTGNTFTQVKTSHQRQRCRQHDENIELQ